MKNINNNTFINNFLVNREKKYLMLSIIFFITLFILIILTFLNYGISWDEEIDEVYGTLFLDYYSSVFKNKDVNNYRNLYLYGAAFDGIKAFITLFSPLGKYETRHLLTALAGFSGIFCCWKIGTFISGIRAGFFSAVSLTMIPMYYGHMYANPKDIPFAVAYIWTLYFLIRFFSNLPDIKTKYFILLGLSTGLTMGLRVGGFILLGYLFVLLTSFTVYDKIENNKNSIYQNTLIFLSISVISYIIMLFFWPWAQLNPFKNPFIALNTFSKFNIVIPLLFEGKYIQSNELPFYYIFKYLWIQLPELILLIIISIFPVFGWQLFKTKNIEFKKKHIYIGIIIFSIIFPLFYLLIRKSVLYDAIRHLLFIIPSIAIVTGLAIDYFYSLAEKSKLSNILPLILTLTLSFYIIFHIVIMVKIHPYQYIYFNQFAGGLNGAMGNYETDYWGTSYKEATENLSKYIEINNLNTKNKILHISMYGVQIRSSYYFKPYMTLAKNIPEVDFVILTTRGNWDKKVDGKIIGVVERFGVPLTVIKDRRKIFINK